jgi:hypothetical protein
MKAIRYVLLALVVLYVIYSVNEMRNRNNAPAPSIQEDNDKSAESAVRKYQMMLHDQHSTQVDVCVQAGLVSSAYLQAQDEMNYKKWKAIQKSDCARAGVPQ